MKTLMKFIRVIIGLTAIVFYTGLLYLELLLTGYPIFSSIFVFPYAYMWGLLDNKLKTCYL